MSKISEQVWGRAGDKDVHLFRMENTAGAYIELTNYGAALVSVNVPDSEGKTENVILGFDTLEGYLNDNCYIGATIGRFANRIGQAKFVLDNKTYYLHANDSSNANHSGKSGFNYKVFDFSIADDTLTFNLLSNDGDGGFPGNLTLKVSYAWTDDNELLINYHAVTDKQTIANFTNHAYFNLSDGAEKVFDHQLTIDADRVLEATDAYIPTGKIINAAHLTFNQNKIKEKITEIQENLSGLNTCYVLNKSGEQPACVLSDRASGRVMEVYTTYPGIMVYTGDYLNSAQPGNHGRNLEPFDGVCLECQFFPDSPNHANFPSTVLNPGEVYKHNITLKFSTI